MIDIFKALDRLLYPRVGVFFRARVSRLLLLLNSTSEADFKQAADRLDKLLAPGFQQRLLSLPSLRRTFSLRRRHYWDWRVTQHDVWNDTALFQYNVVKSGALEPMIDLFRDGTERARTFLARRLGWFNEPRAIPLLTVALLQDQSPAIRRAAVDALTYKKDPAVRPVLIAALKDADSEVARGAATAIGQHRIPEAYDALMAFYETGDDENRAAALCGLAGTGDTRWLAIGRACLRDKSKQVRNSAKYALSIWDMWRRETAANPSTNEVE